MALGTRYIWCDGNDLQGWFQQDQDTWHQTPQHPNPWIIFINNQERLSPNPSGEQSSEKTQHRNGKSLDVILWSFKGCICQLGIIYSRIYIYCS